MSENHDDPLFTNGGCAARSTAGKAHADPVCLDRAMQWTDPGRPDEEIPRRTRAVLQRCRAAILSTSLTKAISQSESDSTLLPLRSSSQGNEAISRS